MKRNLVISFVAVIIMIIVMRIVGHSLITPLSSRGIIDLEFARTEGRLNQLRLFWDPVKVSTNIYLDFVFIAAYGWFFVTACLFIRSRTNWTRGAILLVHLLCLLHFSMSAKISSCFSS